MYQNISKIKDDCLKNGFKLHTNLSEIKGSGLIQLIDSLMLCSMKYPNMCIIERVILEKPQIFRTQKSIREIMKKTDPVIAAFGVMGTCDIDCNIRWLLATLLKINEIQPVKDILATAPPCIKLLYSRILPGETIQFEIQTISEAKIQWWKNFKGRVEIIMDHIRIDEYSTAIVNYKTKHTDKGFFYVEVTCLGGFRECSPRVYVGTEESTFEDKEKYESCTTRITEESPNSNDTELCEDIIPSRESDGIKRVALLVGIMNYKQCDVPNLRAPESDIFDLECVLLKIGFTVFTFVDLDKNKMVHILETFAKTYKEESSYVFFYFAGHGNSFKMSDSINLTDNQMRVSEVLRILLENKPKVLVSIFDMCRNDTSEINMPKLIQEATIPHAENLVLVMSTLPKQKAYEKRSGHESTSLIMKSLCKTLSKYACKEFVNIVLANFVNSCDKIEQQPSITCTGITEVIGIDIPNRRIKPIMEWVKIPADRRLMSCVTVDFKVFHNILNIYVKKSDKNIIKYSIQMHHALQSEVSEGDIEDILKVSLFNSNVIVEDHPNIEFIFSVIKETPMLLKTDYQIKVHFPSVIVPFLSAK